MHFPRGSAMADLGDVQLDSFCPECFAFRASHSRWVIAISAGLPAPLVFGDEKSAVLFWMRPFHDHETNYWGLVATLDDAEGATCVRSTPHGAVLDRCTGSDSEEPAEGVVTNGLRSHFGELACAQGGGCREWTWHTRPLDPAKLWPNGRFELYACTQPGCAAADRLYLLHNSSANHASFEAVCHPCARPPPAQAVAGIFAAVAFLSFAPIALMACHCCHKRRARQRARAATMVPAEINPWPRLPKPWVVAVLFVVSWMTILAAFVPVMLWVTARWWPPYFLSAYKILRFLGPPGIQGIDLCLRVDDKQRTIQALSALQVAVAVLSFSLIAHAVQGELLRPSWRRSRDTEYRPWLRLAMYLEFASYSLILAVWLPLQLPLHLPDVCGHHSRRGPAAALQLWRTSRTAYAVCAGCCFAIALASQVSLSVIGGGALPSEQQEAEDYCVDLFVSGCAWLLAYKLASPTLRTRLHLWTVLHQRRPSSAIISAMTRARRWQGLEGRSPSPAIVTGIPIDITSGDSDQSRL